MGNWELEKIKEFIRGELRKGYDIDTIKTSLHRAGFSGSEISTALSTFNRKPKQGPGFFAKLFAPKKEKKQEPAKEQKKPALKKEEKKPEPKPAEKTGQNFFEKFFYREQKIEAKPRPAPEPIKIELKKPEKPRGPSIFQRLFAKKPKQATIEKPKTAERPKPVKIEIKRPKGPSKMHLFFKKLFAKKPKPAQKIIAPKPKKPEHKIKITLPKLKFPKINFPKLPKIPHVKGAFAVIFLILFFSAIGAYIWFFPTACATENCFVRHANNCGKVSYSNIVSGTTMLYEANNCVLKKTITAMAADEPQNMIDAFLGKNMLCKYKQGDFSPLYVNTLTGLLTTCEGDLRIAIQQHVV